MKASTLLLAASLFATTVPALALDAPVAIYNEQADARADVNQALAQARAEHKQVLVVYGANWCPDCRALDGKLKTGALAAKVKQAFVVVKVDVGRFNHNTDLAQQMGVPLKKGIPTVAVLGSDGAVLSATSGGELADARGMGDDAVLQVFETLGAKH
ncbi:MAG: thioredoxin family protein [Pelomonas sp.]|nr:thioredoxin family protein [Roseateles sp.]